MTQHGQMTVARGARALPGSPGVRNEGQGNAGLMPCFTGRPAL
jgi:hypothetical protein